MIAVNDESNYTKISNNVDLFLTGRFSDTYFDRSGWFNPAVLSLDLQKKFHALTLKDSGEIYIYNKNQGRYEPNGDKTLREIIKKVLDLNYRETYAKATIDDITASTYIERKNFQCPPYLIPVKNGLIDLRTSPQYKIQKHSPGYYIMSVLPVEYNPNAKCPKFEEFLVEILPDINDQVRIQEGFGNCLITSREYMIIYMLYGEGANGKSTLLNVLSALLGEENVSNVSLYDIAYGRWDSGNLYGKLANIHADIELKELKNTGAIKILTGDDMAKGEKKYHNPFYFKNHAKPWFSTNVMPYIYDDSDAFHRRWRIIEFSQKFLLGAEQTNTQMIKELTTPEELSGILNWALEGLRQLQSQKKFSYLKSVEERRETWHAMSSPLKPFIRDCVGFDESAYVTKEDFYQAYRRYCVVHHLPVMTKEKIGRILPKVLPGVGEIYKLISGKQEYCWDGIYLLGENKNM